MGAISPHKKLWLLGQKTVVYGGMESRAARATSASVLELAVSWCRRFPIYADNLLECGLKLKLRVTPLHIRSILKS